MDESSLSSALLTILGFVFLHGLIALAFGALNNIRVNLLKNQAESGRKSAGQVIILAHETPNLQVIYQLATRLIQFTVSALAVLFIAQPLTTVTTVAPFVVYALVVFLVLVFTLILGELVPEAVGSTYANSIAMLFLQPMRVLVFILSPLTWLILLLSRGISSIFSSSELVNRVTEEEIMTLVDAGHTGGIIEDEEKAMIYSVLQLDQTRASEVMVPRIDISALDVDTPLETARAEFIQTGYSRIPIYENNVDSIIGLLYAKDLLTYWHNGNKEKIKSIRNLMRPAYFVPEDKRADELLKELQSKRVHMAVVIDEYGGTAGLVTIENIIEEIIGDIQDEYDQDEEADYVELGENEYLVDASMDLDHLNNLLEVELPTDESDTLGGYLYTYFGRVPLVQETFDFEDRLTLRVESVDGRRIRKVYIIRHNLEQQEDEDSDSDSSTTTDQETSGIVDPEPG